MSNGVISNARIDALMTADQRTLTELLLKSQEQLEHKVDRLSDKVEALTDAVELMQRTCAERGKKCPVVHPELGQQAGQKLWLMWGSAEVFVRGILIPAAVAILIILISRVV